ncbi:hypothetical protein BX616_005204, partial [Lobosporangium transversale]
MAIAGSLTSVFSRSSPVSPPLSSSAIRNVKAQHPMFCVRGTAARYQGVPKVLNVATEAAADTVAVDSGFGLEGANE